MHPRWFKITSFIDCDRCSLFIDRQAPYSGDALCQLRRVLRAVSNQILALALHFTDSHILLLLFDQIFALLLHLYMHISCLPSFSVMALAWLWLTTAIILYNSHSHCYPSLSLWLWLVAAIILSHCVRQCCWAFWRRCQRLFLLSYHHLSKVVDVLSLIDLSKVVHKSWCLFNDSSTPHVSMLCLMERKEVLSSINFALNQPLISSYYWFDISHTDLTL